ncbi:hypothetical protein D4764_03G0011460 [Takifugu flavidus]|uniref:Uncharacterized protein n=1 Tax=Takifugu flavidus TaxID=433684 RepID=A0A5C6NB82_9TELE|nr:hypothetical protein D4764_03G0011460 [Takifugu flavidus]
MVQDEIRAEVEEDRRVKMVAMYQQGKVGARRTAKTHLARALETRTPAHQVPHPVSIRRSPKTNQSAALGLSSHCDMPAVLRTLADTVSAAINNCKYQNTPKQSITFVRAGEKAQQPSSFGGLLTTAQDWKLQVDLGRQLKFPEHISTTSLRPDMVLTSESTKQVVLVELTVPWEDRLEEANERKRAKYANLVIECQNKGWKARCEPVERLRRKPQNGYGSGGGIRGVVGHLDASRELITPGWVARARVFDDQRPETPYDLGFITDDASK